MSHIDDAIAYLKSQDLKNMPVGRYDVNDDFYFMVQEYETKDPAICKLETHKVYTDIQWMISGEEAVEYVPFKGLSEKVAYDADKDVAFWEEPECMEKKVLHDGDYLVLPPELAHKPGQWVGSSMPVKKCVAKVK